MNHPLISVALGVLPALVLIGCGEGSEPPKKEIVRPVLAMKVADIAAYSRRWFPGRAAATREVALSFRIAGPLISRGADVGNEVKKGDVLARVDPRQFEIRVRDAQAQLERSRANLKAMQQARPEEVRQAGAAVKNAQAQLERSRANLKAMQQARPEEVRQAGAAVQKAQAAAKLAESDFNRIMAIRQEDPGAVAQAIVDRMAEKKDRADADLQRANEDLRIAQVGARAEDVSAQEAEIRSMEAALDAANEDLRIAQIGARAEDISAQEAEIRSLEAAVDAAEDDRGYTYLRAPFDGTVVATYVENFEDVRAKQPIVRIVDASQIEMTVDIPESLISMASYVQSAVVVFDAAPDKEIRAQIKEIGTEASETTRTYPVTLIMDQPEGFKVLPGMAGKVQARGELPSDMRSASVEVPVSAVFSAEDVESSYVWVIDDQARTVTRRKVVTGQLTERGIEIREGLEPGEWIATAGVHFLQEGQMVRILEDQAG